MQGDRPWLSLHAQAAPAELHPSHLSWQSTSLKVGKPPTLPTLNLALPHTGSRTNPPQLRGQRQTQLHSFCAAIPTRDFHLLPQEGGCPAATVQAGNVTCLQAPKGAGSTHLPEPQASPPLHEASLLMRQSEAADPTSLPISWGKGVSTGGRAPKAAYPGR